MTIATPTPKAYPVAYVAAALVLATKTVRRMIQRGEIHATRCGRAVRIPAAEIERLLAGTDGR
ncbi:MAG TPA: helix-turn-helix domain-containing protein [Gemmataceae bacterium]|nr:helix-turn-helix domain-containing protein [Gemmataceae bacterium]